MRKLIWHNSFKRAYRKYVKKRPILKQKIFDALEKLISNPFERSLQTHRLKGRLDGLWACRVEYDCRIIFGFEEDSKNGGIVLIDIGDHDEVY